MTAVCWLSLVPVLWVMNKLTDHGATWDRLVLQAAHQQSSALLDAFFLRITWAGSLYVLFPLTSFVAALLWRFGRGLDALLIWGALAGTVIITQATKKGVARPRPDLFAPLGELPSDFSFPSAHTAQITALVLASWLIVHPPSSLPAVLAGGAGLLLIAAVACSRIYLQLHYPSDVIAGGLAAALWVLGLHGLLGIEH